MKKMGVGVGLAAGIGLGIYALSAFAGDGDVTPVMTGASLEKVRIASKVYVDLPRTAEEFEHMKGQLRSAATTICDASDGLMSLEQITFVNHPMEKAKADVIWYRRSNGRGVSGYPFGKIAATSCAGAAQTSPRAPDGASVGQFLVYGAIPPDMTNGEVIGHEFGHLVMGLPDHYSDQRGRDIPYVRSTAFSGRPSHFIEGIEFFRHPRAGYSFTEAPRGGSPSPFRLDGATPLYSGGAIPGGGGAVYEWWLQNNSLMQEASGQVCRRTSDGLSPGEVNQLWSDLGCHSNDDCFGYRTGWDATQPAPAPGEPDLRRVAQAGDFSECIMGGIPNNSELAVASNLDLDRFDMTRGTGRAVAEPAADAFEHPGNEVVLAGFLYPSTQAQPAAFALGGTFDVPYCQNENPANLACTNRCAQFGNFPSGYGDVAQAGINPAGVEFQCGSDGIASARCPGQSAVGSTDFGSPAQCDGCVLANTTACSAPLGRTTDLTPGSCGNGVVDFDMTDASAANWRSEQCDTGTADPRGVVMWDHDQNGATPTVPLTCGTVFSDFRLRGLGQSLADASPVNKMVGGQIHCQNNCLYDLSNCSFPFHKEEFRDLGVRKADGTEEPGFGPDGKIQLWEAQTQSFSMVTELFDKKGELTFQEYFDTDLTPNEAFRNGKGLNLSDVGPSNHGLFAFFKRHSRTRPLGWPDAPGTPNVPDSTANLDYSETWQVTFGMDEAEFGGSSGVLRPLRTLLITYAMDYPANSAVITDVNGVAIDPVTQAPILRIGDTADTGDAWGTQTATGALADRGSGVPAAFDVKVDLRSLTIKKVQDWNCSAAWAAGAPSSCTVHAFSGNVATSFGVMQTYARNGLNLIPGTTQLIEAPQYPSILYFQGGNTVNANFYHKASWNPDTRRYESSQYVISTLEGAGFKSATPPTTLPTFLSDWELLRNNLCDRYGIDANQWVKPIRATPDQIEPGVPANCGSPTFNDDFVASHSTDFGIDTQIIFVMDRSGSMTAPDIQPISEPLYKRLDFAKFAARNFYDVLTLEGDGPRVGLVYYSNESELALPNTANSADDPQPCTPATAETDCGDPASTTGSGVCWENGFCKNRMVRAGPTRAAFIAKTVPAGAPVEQGEETPLAEGGTATGAALELASKLFDKDLPGVPPSKRVLVHLSDGLANIPFTGTCENPGKADNGQSCSSGCGGVCSDARVQVENAITQFQKPVAEGGLGGTFWDFPMYFGGWQAFGQQAPFTPDAIFPGMNPDGEDIVPLFFDGYAGVKGQQLARNHLSLPKLANTSYLTPAEYDIEVEEGAQRIVLSISDMNNRSDPFRVNSDARLVAPSGISYGFYDMGRPDMLAQVDQATAILTVLPAGVETGTWSFRHRPSQGGDWIGPEYYVSAFVDNPLPGCRVDGKKVYKDGEKVRLVAQASYERPIVDGVTFPAKLIRADLVMVDLAFTKNSITGEFEAEVPASDLVGTGQYIVNVSCDVEEGAKTAFGERRPNEQPENNPPEEELFVPRFKREVHTSFYLDSAVPAPIPGDNPQPPEGIDDLPPTFGPGSRVAEDCDLDGIPNVYEFAADVDSDSDGIPDICDTDGNGNEVPDGSDPDYPPNDPDFDDDPWGKDNCPTVANPDQSDIDGDGLGDLCDPDPDNDDPPTGGGTDNCPFVPNPDQTDTDGDGIGDACDENSIVANAGPDQLIECTANSKAVATLDGSASFGPPGPLTYLWTSSSDVTLTGITQVIASGSFPLGTRTATLTVSQGPVSQSDDALITVRDITPPVLTVPPDVTAASCTSVNLGTASATDGCGGTVTIVNNAPASFKAGNYTITWRAIDRFGNETTKTQRLTVGLGDSTSCCPSGTNIIVGTSNNDNLTGTSGADCIFGRNSQDVINGLGGNDFLSGGEGNDTIDGGEGNDFIDGGTAQDILRGGNGNDIISGGDGDDQCFGGNNDDFIRGGQGQDRLFGESGNDALFGDIGDDRLEGGSGNDALDGGGLHDTCIGGTGTNTFTLCEIQQ